MTVRKYIYDGDAVLQETDGAGVVQAEYTWTGEGYGDLLSTYDGSAAKYYEPDALGSTDALADQSQAVVDRWKYRANGAATQTAGTDATPFTWVGRQGYFSDSQTGLYLLGSGTRHYDSATVQFLSRDPTSYKASDANLFQYGNNNPINRIDPSGLRPVTDPSRWRDLLETEWDRIGCDISALAITIAALTCPLYDSERLALYNVVFAQNRHLPSVAIRAAKQKLQECECGIPTLQGIGGALFIASACSAVLQRLTRLSWDLGDKSYSVRERANSDIRRLALEAMRLGKGCACSFVSALEEIRDTTPEAEIHEEARRLVEGYPIAQLKSQWCSPPNPSFPFNPIECEGKK